MDLPLSFELVSMLLSQRYQEGIEGLIRSVMKRGELPHFVVALCKIDPQTLQEVSEPCPMLCVVDPVLGVEALARQARLIVRKTHAVYVVAVYPAVDENRRFVGYRLEREGCKAIDCRAPWNQEDKRVGRFERCEVVVSFPVQRLHARAFSILN